jgi:hypothetical protein
MKTISFGSAKNIGKKEKYYLKKYLYIIKNFQSSIVIQPVGFLFPRGVAQQRQIGKIKT